MRCPVCRAENALDLACRRCKADLALLVQLERQRQALVSASREALALGDAPQALRAAARAHQVRAAADTARLLALGHLLARHFALALRWHQAAADVGSAAD